MSAAHTYHIYPAANSSKRSKNMVFGCPVNSTDFISCIIEEASAFAQSHTYEKSFLLIRTAHLRLSEKCT